MVVSRFAAVIFVLFRGSGIASGAEESTPVFSGPQSGEKLPALKVTLVYGEGAGQTVDLVERAAGKPTLLVIVNGSNRPAARLTRILMNFAEMHQQQLFAGVVADARRSISSGDASKDPEPRRTRTKRRFCSTRPLC